MIVVSFMAIVISIVQSEEMRYELSFPRIIWCYHSGNMHPAVRRMLNYTLESLSPSWNFTFLTDENISLYLDPSTLSSYVPMMIPAHRADYIRLRLLSQYGGWWIDTATLVHSPSIFEEWMVEITRIQAHFFGVCVECPHKIVEVGLMYIPKGSLMMRAWLVEVERMYSIGRANYIYSIYRNGTTFPYLIFRPYPKLSFYMSVYAAQQVVLERKIPRRLPLVIKNAWDTIYLWRQNCHDKRCFIPRANEQLRNPTYPILKVNSFLRRQIWKGSDAPEVGGPPDLVPLHIGVKLPLFDSFLHILWSFYVTWLWGICGIALHRIMRAHLEKKTLHHLYRSD